MSKISDNMTARRRELGLSIPEIHIAMGRLGHDVAYSTVAAWFNGNRGVRNMEHLKALCTVLQTDLNTLAGDEIEIADGKIEATIVRELRDMSPAQREAVLALLRTMKGV